jgi:predicted dinucleotide-binding enzyme
MPTRGSIAANVQAAAPGALVAAAMQHLPAKELGDIDHPIESDVLVCSDHPRAIEATMELLAKMPALRPLDAGPLSSAAPIEAFTAVMIQLNVRYKTRVAVKLTGID